MTEEARQRKERRESMEWANMNDKPAALELCRAIRDNADASDSDRLKAVELIMQLKGE